MGIAHCNSVIFVVGGQVQVMPSIGSQRKHVIQVMDTAVNIDITQSKPFPMNFTFKC